MKLQQMGIYGIIYKITNKVNGMCYVGQTTYTLEDRWRLHYSKGSCCSVLKEAISNFGKEAFSIEQIDIGNNREDLNSKEIYWIKKLNTRQPNGYNIDKGGYSIVHNDEARKKMSENHVDFNGKNNPMYGKHRSQYTKDLIAKRLKGRYTGKDCSASRPVINLDTGERFVSATEAANKYGVTTSTLCKTCNGRQQKTAGYRWAFEEEVMQNVSNGNR